MSGRRTAALLLGFALLVAIGCGGGEPAPPNVVFIVMDTTRADRCSTSGAGKDTTPRLAAIAKEGTNFQNAWSPAGWTGPSHASMFTGLLPEHHGFLRGTRGFLTPDATTLAERFLDAGYRTGCFTNNTTISSKFGLTQGFRRVVPLYDRDDLGYPTARETHRLAFDWAREVHQGGDPFFLFVNDMEAHFPYTPPEEFVGRFVPPTIPQSQVRGGIELPFKDIFLNNAGTYPLPAETVRVLSDLYDAEIGCLDAEVGSLVERLRSAGLLANTILIITADHGENLGEHGLMDHMGSLHRTIRQVPLVVRYPARIPAGEVVDDVVCLEDIAPTLLELCGLPVPEGLDGRHLLDRAPGRLARASLGPAKEFVDRLRGELGIEHVDPRLTSVVTAVFDGRHHYIRYSSGLEELYDLDADPREERSLVPAGGEKLTEMRDRLGPSR